MRKNIYAIMGGLLLATTLHAQQKVKDGTITSGSLPAASAALEVESSSKGFLPPRIALTGSTDVTTIPAPATGTMVISTIDAADIQANTLYWFDGTKWVRPLTNVTIGVAPVTTIWDWSTGPATDPEVELTLDSIYVHGPFTVSQSGWYSFRDRSFFHTKPGTVTATDYNPLVWQSICKDDATHNLDAGALWDARFVLSAGYTNAPAPGFLYLEAGSDYYVKYMPYSYSSSVVIVQSPEQDFQLKLFK